MNEDELKEFEAFKKKQAEDKVKADKIALFKEFSDMLKETKETVKEYTYPTNFPPPPIPKQENNSLDNLTYAQKKFIAKEYLKIKNEGQMAKFGIAIAAFVTVVAGSFGLYTGIGFGFVFMLVGGAWAVLSTKEINNLKQKYQL